MRIERAEVAPYPDGRRVRVTVGWTAFVDRPSLDAVILGPEGETVTTFSVIEGIAREMDFTLHLRGARPGTAYRLRLSLYYPPTPEEHPADADPQARPPDQVVDMREVPFTVPTPGSEEAASGTGRQGPPEAGG